MKIEVARQRRGVVAALALLIVASGLLRAEETPAGETPFDEVMELAGWSTSRFDKFADAVPLTIDERLEIWRLVQRLATFDERLIHRERAAEVTAEMLLAEPSRWRGKLVKVRGTATGVKRQTPEPEDADRFAIDRFYLTTIVTQGGEVVATTAEIPQPWKQLPSLKQPVEVVGLFLKVDLGEEGEPRLLLAANRLAWFPDMAQPPMVNYGMSILGILGVDVSLLDNVVQRQPLVPQDTRAFYEVLSGMTQTNAIQLERSAERHLRQHLVQWREKLTSAQASGDKRRATLATTVVQLAEERRYSVAPFFNTPREEVGQIASFQGIARRALRVVVEPENRVREGVPEFYYELAVFTEDSKNHPIICCVTELPEDFPLGENLREPVRVAGFFFKSWRYYSRRDATEQQRELAPNSTVQMRYAPLFIGHSPQRVLAPQVSIRWGWYAGGGFVVLLGVIWLVMWRLSRSDRAFAAATLARMQEGGRTLDFGKFDEGDGNWKEDRTEGDE